MHPLNEGKPILKGEALSAQMTQLAGMIIKEHAQAKGAWLSALEHARNAGEWLIEARWRKGHRSKWGKWKRRLATEYGIAERTMSQYMQIASHWNDPHVEAARADGFTIDSIGTFLRVLRGQHGAAPSRPSADSDIPDDQAVDSATSDRRAVMKEFASWLRSLDTYEVRIFRATAEDVISVANADLRERVCGYYGGPYYLHRDEYKREREVTLGAKKSPARMPTPSDAEKLAAADARLMKEARRNALPFRGNAEPCRPKGRPKRRPHQRKVKPATTTGSR